MPSKATVDMQALGRRLKAIRLILCLTTKQLSALSGVGVAQINRLENGEKHGVKIDTLVALAVPLWVSIDFLVGLKEESRVEKLPKRPRPRKDSTCPPGWHPCDGCRASADGGRAPGRGD